jgi:hypothetical protein
MELPLLQEEVNPDLWTAHKKSNMKSCIGDRECRGLAKWIKGYVEKRIELIA